MPDSLSVYWYKGGVKEGMLALPVNDPGLLFGATVFTTLRVYGGSLDHELTHWQGHCDRITQSLRAFHWPQPNWSAVRQGCEALAQHRRLPQYPILRITIFSDGRELITGRQLPPTLTEEQTTGVTLWCSDNPLHARSQPQHKTGNYLGCTLALQQAKIHQARDAILINASGDWLETSTGSLWGYHGDPKTHQPGQWWTPPLSAGILPGLQRAWLIEKLIDQRHEVVEQPWTPDICAQFTALAYTNCVIEYLPVHTVLTGKTKLKYDPNSPAMGTLRGLLATARLES